VSRHHTDQPGLQKRLARQRTGIASQHRQLDVFVHEVSQALRRGQRRDCETAAYRLQGALNAHFAVEEQIIFPALRGLHSELADKLGALERDHERLREDVDRLALAIVASDITTARKALEEFDAALSAHERSEERILENA
jgi:iron-sulfur cluster repair protein YtfE (RIC family)